MRYQNAELELKETYTFCILKLKFKLLMPVNEVEGLITELEILFFVFQFILYI